MIEASVRGFGVGRAADQDETSVAIAAIDEPFVVDLQVDARMAKRGTAGDFLGTIAGDAGGGDSSDFGSWLHDIRR